ncbi:2Fe-2S iron-sulfur cluster-binding protein [Dongia sp.]|uniref:2Fe-2S iron-sulfur cluster-binding protein n=1 Tax=Dongia sp. TaxID=1977262 RepID=UPI0037500280
MNVNGEQCTLDVSPRTQLAEMLRDHLDLTATHLGCEHGVCGACTVMLNGSPVRSCIAFAGSCDGAKVETIEGYVGDASMDLLREAFARHHALQCGFCTPGMLATARDLVARLPDADETRIRNELSGNLCRCTGYIGIVHAIQEVIGRRNELGIEPILPRQPDAVQPRGFGPFEAKGVRRKSTDIAAGGKVRLERGWTVVEREVGLAHDAEAVWRHFSDLHAVARCLPGAVLRDVAGETFSGWMEVRFGLISAKFEGEGTFGFDHANRSGELTAHGKDKGGQSNVTGNMKYQVQGDRQSGKSRVSVILRFRIEGSLAQFNRPELVTGFVDFLLAQFVANCDAVLSGGTVRSGGVSAFALGKAVLIGLLRNLFRRK